MRNAVSKGQRFRSLVAVWWLLKERIRKGTCLRAPSSAALPSTADEREPGRTLIQGREHAPCWRQATRPWSQLCPNSQLFCISFYFEAWGLILLTHAHSLLLLHCFFWEEKSNVCFPQNSTLSIAVVARSEVI